MTIEEIGKQIRRLLNAEYADRLLKCPNVLQTFDRNFDEPYIYNIVYSIWRGDICVYVGGYIDPFCDAERDYIFDSDIDMLRQRLVGDDLSELGDIDEGQTPDTEAFYMFRDIMRINKRDLSVREKDEYFSKFTVIYWLPESIADAHLLKDSIIKCFSPCCNDEVYWEDGFVSDAFLKQFDTTDENELLEIVQYDGMMLQYIRTPSYALQLAAVAEDGNALQYIEFPSDELIRVAIASSDLAIRHVDPLNDDLIISAIRAHPLQCYDLVTLVKCSLPELEAFVKHDIVEALCGRIRRLEFDGLGDIIKDLRSLKFHWKELDTIEKSLLADGHIKQY
jgi:hypothetical protein